MSKLRIVAKSEQDGREWDWRGLLRDAQRGDFESIRSALHDVVAMDDVRVGPDPEMQKP